MLAALILFAMVFTTGFGYLLFVNQGSQTINQANAGRQNAVLQAGQEALLAKVALVAGNSLVLSVNNTGGTPLTLNMIYLTDNTGKMISPPGFIGKAGGSNATANWPVTLQPGQATKSLKENIMLTTFTYTGTPVTIEIVTASGNTFGAPYPPAATITPTNGNVLVVNLVATPTATLTCTNCLTVTVTVYNYATSAVTGVALSPSPPTAQVTGTASVTGGSCTGPFRSNGQPMLNDSITAYSGSGNAHYVYYTCTYSAATGAVGGIGSFSTSATGALGSSGVSSAVGISNGVQIGGSSNVPTQGAFAANYFFLKYTACLNAPSGSVGSYQYTTPCTTAPATMPPANPNALANGNYISGVSSYYVAYYVQVTNDFNATLPILKYSYLFMDPGISTEGYSFLVGTATNPQVPYYPNYCSGGGCGGNNLPVLTPYTSDATTCAESAPSYNPPPPTTCIDVSPGQTVTLAFAACGFGSSNWVWGGTTYGQQLDSIAGCISTPPGYQKSVPEGQTFAIVLSYLYKNKVYNQVMPFEGQTVTAQRYTTTSVSCAPSPDAVNAPSTCTVTVTDISSGTTITPTGTVSFAQSPGSGGVFGSGGTCTLSGGGASATCTVTYSPSLGQEGTDTLTATYAGEANHSPSTGQTTLSATKRNTSTAVVCTPNPAPLNTATNCVITVSDTSPGTIATPTGLITLTQNPPSSGAFTPAASCTLSSGSCSVTFTPNNGVTGPVTITGSYGGDLDHTTSSNSASVTWANLRPDTTTVSCPNTPVNVQITCTVTVTDTGSAPLITPTGTVDTFSDGGKGGTFSPLSCTLSGAGGTATCTFHYTPAPGSEGTITISVKYEGDGNHLASIGSGTLTATTRSTTLTVNCPSTTPNQATTCTFTVTDTSAGTTITPTGTVDTFSDGGAGGSFGGPSCTLSSGVCTITYTPIGGHPSITISAKYEGDTNHATSIGTTILTILSKGVDCSASGGSTTNSGVTTAAMTCKSGDLIVVFVAEDWDHSVTGITDSKGVLPAFGSWTERPGLPTQPNSIQVDEFYVFAPAAMTADTITVTFSGSSNHNYVAFAVGIAGASTTTPFDGNAGLPAIAVCTSSCNAIPTVTGVSTSNANDIIIGFEAHTSGNSETAGSGYSLIPSQTAGAGALWGTVEDKTVSTTQSNINVAFGKSTGSGTSDWIMLVDAVDPAPQTDASSNAFTLSGTPLGQLLLGDISGLVGALFLALVCVALFARLMLGSRRQKELYQRS